MNKADQMWYLLLICYDFARAVIPFFRAVVRPRPRRGSKALFYHVYIKQN